MLPSTSTHRASPGHLHKQKWRGRVGLALVASLSVLAGMTDAIGFMASGDFVSFMSGNTTRLAVAISDGDMGLTLRLVILVATFVIGNALGVVVARLGGRRTLPLLLCIATLLCMAAALPIDAQLPALLAAIVAMGMLNAAVEEVNGLPVGLTYVTGALSRFGRGLGRWMLGERRGVLNEEEANRYQRSVAVGAPWELSGLGQLHDAVQNADRLICFGGA